MGRGAASEKEDGNVCVLAERRRGVIPIAQATVRDLARWLERLAPIHLAEPWDCVGLQCGEPGMRVERVMTALTVTGDVIEQASAFGAQAIVAHHPVIYKEVKAVRFDQRIGALLKKMAERSIALYVAHTNLDAAAGGVNDTLAARLGLVDTAPLAPSQRDAPFYKLVTFVPGEAVDVVRDALAGAGAGVIGAYTHCTFGVEGEGTFVPQEGAAPYIGAVGRLERVREVRLETVVGEGEKEKVLAALRKAHPYEEVAVDLYPLARSGPAMTGIGRVGELPEALSTEEFVAKVKKSLSLPKVRLGGARVASIRRVAVVGGSGGSFARQAKAMGADVLITGDVDYHDADEARFLGLMLVDAGHFGTERHVPGDLARYLADAARNEGVALEVAVAEESDALWGDF